tara:strand:+ start:2969 stop:3340 length:372 start_codon:yes stop_codon:yes gene_type:complete
MKIRYMILIFFSITVFSGTVYEFSNVEDEKRFNALIKDIRCPKCTSGSLSSSNAPVSEDLKLKIAEMINENKTDNEIKYYVVSRFGKDSLYEPEFSKETYLLWFSPFVVLLLALSIFIFRKKH